MRFLFALLFMLWAAPALAEAPVVTDVVLKGDRVHVTLTHPDTGWDHYADLWQVYAPDGTLLAERVLAHPHVNEQPFTRATTLVIPDGLRALLIVASCTDGDRSESYRVALP